MKRILALLLAMLMLLTLAACSKDDKDTIPEEDPSTSNQGVTSTLTDEEDNTEEATSDPYSYTFTQFGDAKITIVGAEFVKDDWGDDVMRIYYDYTNTGDSACGHGPATALWFEHVTQDGEDCGRTYFSAFDECAIPEDLMGDCYTQPGCTSRHTMLIECDPAGGPVEIACYVMIGSWMYNADSVELFTFQLDPKNLPGAPEPLVMPAIMEPTYAAGLPTSGVQDYPSPSEISIDGWEITTGDEDELVLRVTLTVTNNGEEADTPMGITNGVEAYQDGFSLLWFSCWDLDATAEDSAYEEDLEPGETVQCNALFLLRNDHPVEIVIEDLNSELRLGTICDVKAAIEAAAAAKKDAEDAANTALAEAAKALIGVWESTNGWEDHYTFNADGTGVFEMTGDEYGFRYTIEGDVLSIYYDDGEEAEYTYRVEGDELFLSYIADDEDRFVRVGA